MAWLSLDELAQTRSELGQETSYHRFSILGVLRSAANGIYWLLIGGTAGILGWGLSELAPERPWIGVPFVLGAIGLLFIGGRALWKQSAFWLLRLAAYPNGILWIERTRFRFIPWEEIREVWQHHMRYRTANWPERIDSTFSLVLADWTCLHFNSSLANARQLGTFIENHVTACLLPSALDELKQGKSVKFGPLVVSTANLRGISLARSRDADRAWSRAVGSASRDEA